MLGSRHCALLAIAIAVADGAVFGLRIAARLLARQTLFAIFRERVPCLRRLADHFAVRSVRGACGKDAALVGVFLKL